MSEGFIQESWQRAEKPKPAEFVVDTTPTEKAFSVFFALTDEVSKIKNRKTKEYLEGVLDGLKKEVLDYRKDIEVVEAPSGKKFLTQNIFENKRRENHNAIITSLLTLYRYLRKEKGDISWADDLGYDDNMRNDTEKFGRWEITDWAVNMADALKQQQNDRVLV